MFENIIKIIIPNLKRAIERREHMIHQFEKLGIKDYMFYDAFDGKDITNESIVGNITPGNIGHPRQFKRGEIGCTLTHIGIITLAKALNYEQVLIIEDDVILCEDFPERFLKLCKYLPSNWEHVFLSGHIYNATPPIIEPSLIPVTFKVSGTYSYMLRNTAYDKAIKKLSSLETTTDDLYEKVIKEGLKSFIFFPFLTYPDVTDSYIWENPDNKRIHASLKYFKNKL
jgi:GR25 family glycosyltransferase involved in LPS biosynthesis